MSAAIAFDTHRFVKNLTANGFTEAQAEALAHEQIHLLEANLATRSDVAAVTSDVAAVKSDVAAVTSDVAAVKSDVAAVKSDVAAVTSDVAAVKSDLAMVKADLEVKIEQVKSSLLIWMVGALTAHLAVVVAVVQFLMRTA